MCMKSLKFRYIAGDKIFTPFHLEYKDIDITSDLLASLGKLFPIKSTFFQQKNPDIFSVSLLPDAPYGPGIEALIELLFPDFSRALAEVNEFFGLPRMSLLSQDHRFNNPEVEWSPHIRGWHEVSSIPPPFTNSTMRASSFRYLSMSTRYFVSTFPKGFLFTIFYSFCKQNIISNFIRTAPHFIRF